MKVLELRGQKSLGVMRGYSALILGLKMLPAYLHESFETFLSRVEEMPPEDQEKLIREAALFVELQKEELEAIVSFCTDLNGVPYSAENIKNLGPKELHEIIVAVCKEMAKIKIDLIGDSEKKN